MKIGIENLIIISAPSGAGKTTLCERLLKDYSDIAYSISCTTRSPRGKEKDGKDYFFISDAEFEQKIRKNDFLEHACVHGYKYGTLKTSVYKALGAGSSVLMDIDVQGADQVREFVNGAPTDDLIKKNFVDVFIAPPSVEELRKRLKGRGEDEDKTIQCRLQNAEKEMEDSIKFKHVIINDDLEKAYKELVRVLNRKH
ncbi:guanylate kinase [Verrucomicrobiota bacterium]